jgi:hypothetical protein
MGDAVMRMTPDWVVVTIGDLLFAESGLFHCFTFQPFQGHREPCLNSSFELSESLADIRIKAVLTLGFTSLG